MTFMTAEPILYTRNDLHGHRARLMIAEKRAAIQTRIVGASGEDFPAFLRAVNPKDIYPFLADKNLVCHGPALDELLHERYPSPALIPVDPILRARDRMLCAEVLKWYDLTSAAIRDKLNEVEGVLDPEKRFLFGYLSIVDITLAPLLHKATFLSGMLKQYYNDLATRPAFAVSLKDSVPTFSDDYLSESVA